MKRARRTYEHAAPNEGAQLLRELLSTRSQMQLAAETGVAPNTIGQYARGERRPMTDVRALLEQSLGIPEASWERIARERAPHALDFEDPFVVLAFDLLERLEEPLQELLARMTNANGDPEAIDERGAPALKAMAIDGSGFALRLLHELVGPMADALRRRAHAAPTRSTDTKQPPTQQRERESET